TPGGDLPARRHPGPAGLGPRRRGLRRTRGGHLDDRARDRRRRRRGRRDRSRRDRRGRHPCSTSHLRSARDPPGHLAHEGTSLMTTDSRTAAASRTTESGTTADPTGPIPLPPGGSPRLDVEQDRKSTRLNSSHVSISYAVFCLKKKTTKSQRYPNNKAT